MLFCVLLTARFCQYTVVYSAINSALDTLLRQYLLLVNVVYTTVMLLG